MSLKGKRSTIVLFILSFIIVIMVTNYKVVYLDWIFKTPLPPYSVVEMNNETFNLNRTLKVDSNDVYVVAKIKLNSVTKPITKIFAKINYKNDANDISLEYFADYADWWRTSATVTDSYSKYIDRKITTLSHANTQDVKYPFCSYLYFVTQDNEDYMYIVQFA